MRYTLLALILAGITASAQPPPPAPPPADRAWASTEGPAWNSFACPDGSVVFSAHLGGPRGLFYSDPTGEVTVTLERDGDDAQWIGDRVVERNEPERRKRVTIDGEPYGGGACVNDHDVTIRERIDDLPGIWVVDARLNPKPERIGLPVPGGMQREGFRQALFVGFDRVQIGSEDVEPTRGLPLAMAWQDGLQLQFTPDAFSAIASLQARHASQPLALLFNGELVGEVQIRDPLSGYRVLTTRSLDARRLARLRQLLRP